MRGTTILLALAVLVSASATASQGAQLAEASQHTTQAVTSTDLAQDIIYTLQSNGCPGCDQSYQVNTMSADCPGCDQSYQVNTMSADCPGCDQSYIVHWVLFGLSGLLFLGVLASITRKYNRQQLTTPWISEN